MSVPETAMHKDNGTPSGKHQIRFPRKILNMQAITETHAMNKTPQFHFRSRTFCMNSRHAFASFFWRESIYQDFTSVAQRW